MTAISYLVSGDNRRTLRALADESVDAVITDPPYGLGKEPDMSDVLTHWLAGDDYSASGGGFMGKSWDSFVPGPATWREVYRVLKPGGHVIMFSGTRTWDIATLALRLAGFEIRDGLMWLYATGFPKSMDVSKAIDKAAGAERQVAITAPATPEAEQWDGWGTALKPAWEPIVLARKPLIGTVIANVLEHKTGALNIDATRIATTDSLGGGTETKTTSEQKGNEGWTRPWMDDPEMREAHAERVRANVARAEQLGRFPANLLLSHTEDCEVEADVCGCVDDCPIKLLDGQSGVLKSGAPAGGVGNVHRATTSAGKGGGPALEGAADGSLRKQGVEYHLYGDSGGASRFFYSAKVAKKERNAGMPEGEVNDHPTVKPIDLMAYLARLVTPPGGVVLDPFSGSGSTGIAAHKEGFGFVGCDNDPRSIWIAKHRMAHFGAQVEVLGRCEP